MSTVKLLLQLLNKNDFSKALVKLTTERVKCSLEILKCFIHLSRNLPSNNLTYVRTNFDLISTLPFLWQRFYRLNGESQINQIVIIMVTFIAFCHSRDCWLTNVGFFVSHLAKQILRMIMQEKLLVLLSSNVAHTNTL